MIILLSPAKTLDFEQIKGHKFSAPRLLEDSQALVKVLKKQSAADLKQLMNVSDNIAELNADRYRAFKTPFTEDNAKQAVLAFKGDVYTGLKADSFNKRELDFAQKHLRILSGLYGVLKPLDLMQPYRLEMGTKLKIKQNKNLYDFWGNRITELLNQDLKDSKSTVFLNLASKEYIKSVKTDQLSAPMINIHFQEERDGKFKVIAFNAKKARGAMAHQIVKNKIKKAAELYGLEINGYIYDEGKSDATNWYWIK